ncbi:recombinase family protein [Burkholderia stagnalis]|uniref:recombinase family protein n=1 Tax=Burkholderia stagnalis TaxID=1503054 RepID=UPI000F80FA64|nr:recombinase family protein [Burkholderia stagnalis]
MIIGYASVFKDEENLQLQVDSLIRSGCENVFTDRGLSNTNSSHPGLDSALATLQPGDTLVVWRLDRLGYSPRKLIDLIRCFDERSITFSSINESINTSSAGGLLALHLMEALAQFKHSFISERTRAGITAARAQGKKLGRKPALDAAQRAQAIQLLKVHTVNEVAARFKVHPRTVKRLTEQN